MLRLAYRVVGAGWAEATVSDGDASIIVIVSYLSDALADLARAIVALLHGQHRATVFWWDEPGEYRLRLTRNADMVTLRIDSRGSYHPDDTIFRATAPLVDLADQVTNQLTALLEQHGESGYREQWVLFPFPRSVYETLLRFRRQRCTSGQ